MSERDRNGLSEQDKLRLKPLSNLLYSCLAIIDPAETAKRAQWYAEQFKERIIKFRGGFDRLMQMQDSPVTRSRTENLRELIVEALQMENIPTAQKSRLNTKKSEDLWDEALEGQTNALSGSGDVPVELAVRLSLVRLPSDLDYHEALSKLNSVLSRGIFLQEDHRIHSEDILEFLFSCLVLDQKPVHLSPFEYRRLRDDLASIGISASRQAKQI